MLLQSIKSVFSKRAKSRVKLALGVHPTMRLLRGIESSDAVIDSASRRLCDQYSREVLGGREYALWLYVYTAIAGEFKEGWIPDNYYADHVIPAWKGNYGEVSSLNALQCLIGIGFFPDLLYRVNGICMLPDRQVISAQQALEILSANESGLVFKADGGMQGRSVMILRKGDVRQLDLRSLPDGVFQRFILQHPDLARFHPRSVATLRLTTVIGLCGQESLRAAYVRFGSGQDGHVKSASHLRVPVDLSTGLLSETGYTTSWCRINRHPDTLEVFGGSGIPGFAEAVDLVLRAQREMPFARCIGWDVAVDSSGKPHILEWNGGHNDIKFSEATMGPCFADLGWESLWR